MTCGLEAAYYVVCPFSYNHDLKVEVELLAKRGARYNRKLIFKKDHIVLVKTKTHDSVSHWHRNNTATAVTARFCPESEIRSTSNIN